MNRKGTAGTATLGLLLAFALILGYVETLIPFPFGVPGMKLGLPNLAVLLVLYLFGAREALLVNICRVCLSAFMFGSLSSLLYSLAGAFFSFSVNSTTKAFLLSRIFSLGKTIHLLVTHVRSMQKALSPLTVKKGQTSTRILPMLESAFLLGRTANAFYA